MKKGKTRLPIIRNPAYGDIITAIRLKKISATDILERLHKPKNLKNIDFVPNERLQSALSKQLQVLIKEGYIIEDKIKRKHNVKLLEVKWEKIVDDFIKYAILIAKSSSEHIRKHKDEFRKNFFFVHCIKLYFDNLGWQGYAGYGVVLAEHFRDILNYDWFSMFIKDFMDDLQLSKMRSVKGDKIFFEELGASIGKQKVAEFKRFERLVALLPSGKIKDRMDMASTHAVTNLMQKYLE